jgi:hypothetical protein
MQFTGGPRKSLRPRCSWIMVHHGTILKERMQQRIKILLFLILNEASTCFGRDTPPIIRSLKLHKQPLVLHNTVEGCRTCSCWTTSNSCTSALFKIRNNKSLIHCCISLGFSVRIVKDLPEGRTCVYIYRNWEGGGRLT